MNFPRFIPSQRTKKFLRIFSFHIEPNRIYGLDILRAAAIFFVLLLHGTTLLSPHVVSWMFPFILDGVTMFFVLSGFLIGTILIRTLEEKKATISTLKDFWIKRWFRTLPNYFLTLSLLCLLSFLFDPTFRFSATIKYFFFVQNLYTPHPGFFGEAWSLSVEEWFYLLIPIILFTARYLTRLPVRTIILATSLLVILLVTSFRFYRFLNTEINTPEEWWAFIAKQVITRLDGIMFGVLGACISYYKKSLWIKAKNICFVLGILMLIAVRFSEMNTAIKFLKIYMCVFFFSFYQLSVLLLLPFLTQVKTGKGIIFRMITTVSMISYSIYLLHFSLVRGWIVNRFSWFGLKGLSFMIVTYSFYWILSIFFSLLVYKYFERPMMNYRKKFVRKTGFPFAPTQ